jgi:hypothetical protein
MILPNDRVATPMADGAAIYAYVGKSVEALRQQVDQNGNFAGRSRARRPHHMDRRGRWLVLLEERDERAAGDRLVGEEVWQDRAGGRDPARHERWL